MKLVYLSPLHWNDFEQRPHKLIDWWHKNTGGDVLWVNPYPTRLPKVSDFKRRPMKLTQPLKANPKWLLTITPPSLPIEPFQWSGRVNKFLWKKTFNAIEHFISDDDALIGIGKPTELALQVINRFDERFVFYDAMDDFPAFYSSFSRDTMKVREHEISKRVNVIWVSSSKLKKKWRHMGGKLKLVHNGVDAFVSPPPISENKYQKKRVLGYVGTVGRWFDWEWVLEIARLCPEDTVRIIGPIFNAPPRVIPSNIELMSPCSHEEAIKAMQGFDVGLIPFKDTMLTESVDPIKYYEYKSIGLPVLSTCFGEMAYRLSVKGVYVCKVNDNLSEMLNQALLHETDRSLANSFKLENTWGQRFDSANLI